MRHVTATIGTHQCTPADKELTVWIHRPPLKRASNRVTRFSLGVKNQEAEAGLDGTAEPVSRNQILRHQREHVFFFFFFFFRSADPEQDWQPYPVGPYYSAKGDD